jgi:hypothetical protein
VCAIVPVQLIFSFYRKYVDCFPGMFPNIIFSSLVTVPVSTMTVGMTKHFMFYIRQFVCLFLYFYISAISSFIAFLCEGVGSSVIRQILSCFKYYVWSVCQNLSVPAS